MQQSSATQSLHLSFWGLRKIVAYSHSSSQCLLVPTVFGTVSSLHPTSFLMIFILVPIVIFGAVVTVLGSVVELATTLIEYVTPAISPVMVALVRVASTIIECSVILYVTLYW